MFKLTDEIKRAMVHAKHAIQDSDQDSQRNDKNGRKNEIPSNLDDQRTG